MAKKKTAEKALNIDNILFNCRDILRAACCTINCGNDRTL